MKFRPIEFLLFLIFLIIVFGNGVFAKEIKLEQLYIEAAGAVGTNRTPLMQIEEKKGELNLFTKYSYGDAYTDVKITSFFGRQFRYVELNYETGYSFKQFDVYLEHTSGHALDYQYQGFKYPNTNSVGFRLNLK